MDDDLEREAKAAARRNPPVRGEDWPDPEERQSDQAQVSAGPSTPDPNDPTPADLDPRRR